MRTKTGCGRRKPALIGVIVVLTFCAALVFAVLWQPWLDIQPPAMSGLAPGYVYTGGPVVTLELKNFTTLPRALVLVNHEPRASFGQRYITIPVADGDRIEVDGSFYSHPLDVEVLDVSRNISSPPAGRKVVVDGTVTAVGTVRLSQS